MAHRPAAGAAVVAAVLAALVRATAQARPPWLTSAKIIVPGDLQNQDCRTGVCKHNENTDLNEGGSDRSTSCTGPRAARCWGPNSSLRVYRSRDKGKTFKLQAMIPAPADRDIRDPSFYEVGKRLYIKAITRLPGFALRDTGAGSISVEIRSKDGSDWSAPRAIGPEGVGLLAGDRA